ncbi:MAG: hypothetical protein ACQKBW_11690 [Puniceicoccales bacterium]
MNHPIPSRLLCVALISIFAGVGATSQAATLFEFGPSSSYVSSDVDFARQTSESTTGAGYTFETAFSDSQALSPSSGYSGPTFYGGYRFTSSDINSGLTNQKVRSDYTNLNNNDALWLQTYRSEGWADGTYSFAAVFVFKQEDFNADYTTGDIGVDGMSTTFYYNSSGTASDVFNPEGRWLIEKDGSYYISEATIMGPKGGSSTVEISGSELTSTQWAAYNPTDSLLFDSGSASFESISLSGITSVGVYFGDDSFTGSTSTNASVVSFGVSEFSASGSNIPEADFSMLLLPLLVLVSGRRILKKRCRC